METYTIESWLRGHIDYDFPSDALTAVLYDRGVDSGSYVSETTLKQRELCLADLLMYAANSSTSTTGEYESDGGWQHQKSNKNVVDRSSMREQAARIYEKWSDSAAETAKSRQVTLRSIYDV